MGEESNDAESQTGRRVRKPIQKEGGSFVRKSEFLQLVGVGEVKGEQERV